MELEVRPGRARAWCKQFNLFAVERRLTIIGKRVDVEIDEISPVHLRAWHIEVPYGLHSAVKSSEVNMTKSAGYGYRALDAPMDLTYLWLYSKKV